MNSQNFSDFIKIIITVVIVLLLGAAAFGFWAVTSGFIGRATDKVSDISVQMDESQITQYEGAIVSGTQVVAAIKNLENEFICVTVNNGKTSATYIYTDGSFSTKSDLSVANTQRKNSEYYINPNAKYIGKVERNEATGGTIETLIFDIYTE